ncbi:hypothetical protein V6N13_047093 [Hibiscus sabdariffa]
MLIYFSKVIITLPFDKGKDSETSKIDVAAKKEGPIFQPADLFNPDSAAKNVAHTLKDDIDAESSTVIPLAAVTLPLDILAAGNADASANEEADDMVVAAEEGGATLTLPAAPTQHALLKISPILNNDMGKFLLPTWEVLVQFDDWMLNESTNLAAISNTIPLPQDNTIPQNQASHGNKQRSLMLDPSITKKSGPPLSSNVKAGMSSRKNSPAEV